MSHDPLFIAYTVAVLLNALPFGGRVVLLEPTDRPTAQFFPDAMPADLATKPALRGEKRVWLAFRRAPFPAGTRIFYNRAPKGCWRRADMLILIPQRGIIAIEVKGGRVAYCGGLRQQLSGSARGAKRIRPWGQAQRAVAQALAALGLNPIAIPQAFMLAMPDTSASELPFPPAPHMLTAEDLAPALLADKITGLLPPLDIAASAQLVPVLDSIAAALIRPADEEPPPRS